MSKRAVVGLVSFVIVVAVVWFTASRSSSDHDSSHSNPTTNGDTARGAPNTLSTPVEPPPAAASISDTTPDPTAVASTRDRRPLPAPALRGRVLDAEDRPIADATVSWTALPALLDPTPLVDWAELERTSVWTSSDANGEFGFDATPADLGPSGSVVWITHSRHVASATVLVADSNAWEPTIQAVMQPAPRVAARVVDAQGAAVARATVRQRAFAPDRATLDRSLSIEERARIVLFRSSVTDESGAAALHAFLGDQAVHAERGGFCSTRWRGVLQRDIVLSLFPTYFVEGSVRLDGAENLEGDLYLSIAAHLGADERRLSTHIVTANEPFGPFGVPLMEGARYSFRIQGGRAVSTTEFRDAPAAGTRLHVDLASSLGNDMWFRLLDENAQVPSSGSVLVQWDRSSLRESVTGVPLDKWPGYILVRGCPNGRVDVYGSAPGFATTRTAPYTLPPPQPLAYEITLVKAGRIEGRCTADGKPVPDFDVVLWPSTLTYSARTYHFTDRDDGSFVIDEAPLGEVILMAASERHGRADQKTAKVHADQPTRVEIELAKTVVGRGRVVDEAGDAVPHALVQLYFNNAGDLFAPWGPPRPVRTDGSFELRGFPAGQSYFKVSATGFSSRNVGVDAEADKEVDLGKIVLFAAHDLEVRLLAPASVDTTAFSVESGVDDGRLARQSFSHEGKVKYASVDAGRHILLLRRPDGSFEQLDVALFPGQTWIVDFDASGTGALVVELALAPGTAIPPRAQVTAQYTDSTGRTIGRFAEFRGKEQLTLEGLPGGSFLLRISDGASSKILASLDTTLGAGERKVVTVPLSDHKLRFHVVDAERNNLSAAMVQLYDPAGGAYAQSELTDAAGACEFQGVPDGPLLVGLAHDVLGNVWGTPLERTNDPERVIELQLAPKASVEVQLVDGDVPVEGIACQLQDTVRRLGVTVATKTDAAGRVRWSKLGAATYSLFTWHKDYWPADAEVVAREDAKATQVQVRMLGGVAITVRNSVGAPVVNLPVELRSVEFGMDVAEWVRSKRAQASSATLTTDAEGKLSVTGVPHGRYTWRVVAGAEPVEGVVVVPRGSTTSAPISIP